MIRNFIYLDSDKLRSFSSQLFEGITEQVVSSRSERNEKNEMQKGPVGSGRLLADIFSQEGSSAELKFLEDHAYTLFEDHLTNHNLIASFASGTNLTRIDKSFVKVTSKLQINDLAITASVVRDFNKFGEAFWRVTNEQMQWSPTGQKIASDGDAKKKAGEAGFQMNQKVSDAAAHLMEFGYKDLIEAHMDIEDGTFSAPLKRTSLREQEWMIIHKYSRLTQAEFTMVGVITQQGGMNAEKIIPPEVSSADGMKHAMRLLANHLRVLENTFSAALSNEVILDPIALYSTL
jgi:hypothetical protein